MQKKRLHSDNNSFITAVLGKLMYLHPRTIDLSLNRVQRLLHVLGHPEDSLPPIVHVAGTNGKGSVIAYLQAFLETAGLTVHTYTSPHLVRFNERICLAGTPIQDSMLLSILDEVEQANSGQPITFFEITTCAALLIFSRIYADIILIETGLGGRLDATNILKKPILTILTTISMDHEQYLGRRIETIALEKAHILKPGVKCITARQESTVSSIFEIYSLETGTQMWREGFEWNIDIFQNNSMIFSGTRDSVQLPFPALTGIFQVRNAGLAIAAAEHLPFDISFSQIAVGLQRVQWPGRLQLLVHGPLIVAITSHNWEIWVDGGHNPSAGEALAKHVRTWHDKSLVLIIGMLRTKDARGFIVPLIPHAARIRTVSIPGVPDSHSSEYLATVAVSYGHPDARPSASLVAAVSELSSRSTGRILITGSLHLAGYILSKNY